MKRFLARLSIAGVMAISTIVGAPVAQMAGAGGGAFSDFCRSMAGVLLPTVASAADCPAPTPGSVTGETGSIKGQSLTDLIDAYTSESGVSYQHQMFSTLSNKNQACSHYRNNQVVANEKWLILIQTAARSDGQYAPYSTGTYTIDVGDTDSTGTLRTADATYAPKGRTCSTGGEQTASSGTITYTTVTSTLVEGSYDLWFNSDHVTGTFSAPVCTLCASRPTKLTCLKA
jgi:hypothetical protein